MLRRASPAFACRSTRTLEPPERTVMISASSTTRTTAKLLAAAVVIGVVLVLAGRHIAPRVPSGTWVLWCALGLCAFVAVAFLWALIDLQARHWALRRGGTEVEQWCWRDSARSGISAPAQQGPRNRQARK